MAQLSRERIEQYISDPLEYGLTRSEQMEMARRLLAVEGQEPVAYMYRDKLHADARFSLEPRFGNWSPEDINEYEITETKLYAAPPAPVAQPVQVPDELLSAMEEVLRISDRDHEAWKRAREGIAACRAAMLQDKAEQCDGEPTDDERIMTIEGILPGNAEPVSQPYKLPDGWKLVPVEPTLAMLTVLGFTGSFESMKQRYEAMLAAAPQPVAVVDERAAFNSWSNEDNLPIAGVGAKNAAWLAWQARSALQPSSGALQLPDGLPPMEHLDIIKFNADCAMENPDSIYANEFFLSLDEIFGEKGNYSLPVQAKAISVLIAEIFRIHGYKSAPQEPTK